MNFRAIILSTILIGYVAAINMAAAWEEFLVRYSKSYIPNSKEYQTRRAIFLQNLNDIRIHNEQYYAQRKYVHHSINYKLGINEFTDLSYDEFIEKYTFRNFRYKSCPFDTTSKSKTIAHKPLRKSRRLPNFVDWTRKFSNIENQADCHCSWAYATAAVIEAALDTDFISINKLSAQQLRDCIKIDPDTECISLIHQKALEYAKEKGISLATLYRKTESKEGCNDQNMLITCKITEYHRLMRPDEDELKRIIAFIGPVVATVAVPKTFKQYGGGQYIYNDPHCTDQYKDQNVVIVGYGTEPDDGPYWNIRNSWGTSWGNNGYMKLAMNQSNLCGIASEVVYPVVK